MVINFHCICSIMKIYIICYVPVHILYLGKILFLRYRPKYQSDFWIFKSTISLEQINETASFFYMLIQIYKKLKVYQKHFSWTWSKMGVTNLDCELYNLLYLKNEQWNNWFFGCWYRFAKTKSWSKIFWVGIVKNGHGL